MDQVRKKFTDPEEDNAKSVTKALIQTAKAVEDGGRDSMIYAVDVFEADHADDDSDLLEDWLDADEPDLKKQVKKILEEAEQADSPKKSKQKSKKKSKGGVKSVKGWARVPTGAETCGWCLMLCSRGPVYKHADSAGLNLQDKYALQDYDAGQEIDPEDMEQWHAGCDCKVVPVFDTRSWPGKEQADSALELWKEASRLADEELERHPNKKSFVGGKWIPTTRNREAINQMRRLVEG